MSSARSVSDKGGTIYKKGVLILKEVSLLQNLAIITIFTPKQDEVFCLNLVLKYVRLS